MYHWHLISSIIIFSINDQHCTHRNHYSVTLLYFSLFSVHQRYLDSVIWCHIFLSIWCGWFIFRCWATLALVGNYYMVLKEFLHSALYAESTLSPFWPAHFEQFGDPKPGSEVVFASNRMLFLLIPRERVREILKTSYEKVILSKI